MINPNIYAQEVMHNVLDKFEEWIRQREREGVKKIETEEIKKILFKLRLNVENLNV